MDDRRTFLLGAGALSALIVGCAKTSAQSPHGEEEEEEVSPAEDLMREHGLLNRVLLMYEEGARRIEAKETMPIQTLASAAEVVRVFVEQYHEKLEEDFLFPRFEKANKLTDLVTTLRAQHKAGATLTATILALAKPATLEKDEDKLRLRETMRAFVRMYRPHEAREDTVLFPALPTVIGKKELEELGEQFEDKEHALFGKAGFQGMVEKVAGLEKELGIHDLNQFTPP